MEERYEALHTLVSELEGAQGAAEEAGEQNTADLLGDLIHTHRAALLVLEGKINDEYTHERRAMTREYWRAVL